MIRDTVFTDHELDGLLGFRVVVSNAIAKGGITGMDLSDAVVEDTATQDNHGVGFELGGDAVLRHFTSLGDTTGVTYGQNGSGALVARGTLRNNTTGAALFGVASLQHATIRNSSSVGLNASDASYHGVTITGAPDSLYPESLGASYESLGANVCDGVMPCPE